MILHRTDEVFLAPAISRWSMEQFAIETPSFQLHGEEYERPCRTFLLREW